MPRRNSKRVQPIRLAGRSCVPITPEVEDYYTGDDPPEWRDIDWQALAEALGLGRGGSGFLEFKAAGLSGPEIANELHLSTAKVEKLRRSLYRRIEKGPLPRRERFERVISGGNSLKLAYRERPGDDRSWTLSQLYEGFTEILRRERTKNISTSTCSSDARSKSQSLGGTDRELPTMEKKSFRFELKSLDDVGTFEGMLSPYNRVDLGGDMILPGAYTKSLAESGGKVPLLLGHEHNALIGDLFLRDTPEGLRAKGVLDMELSSARDVYVNLSKRRLRGMSIGYEAVKKWMEDGVRKLGEIALREGSLCLWPMEPHARVESVKARQDVIALLRDFHLFDGPGARR